MSKERARRRAEREHEAAIRTAARAAEQERRERQEARRRAVKAATTDRLRRKKMPELVNEDHEPKDENRSENG